jgi:CheY-like chemotaxis protein
MGTGSSEEVASQAESHRSSRERRRGYRILLAEDNAVNQELAARILEKQGHRVAVAQNGREALAALEHSSGGFDLILMDVQMPELDGLEATAMIRDKEQSTGTHIPIVALTAHALKGDRERCLAAGMDAYLAKPIQPDRLRRVVEEMVSTSARRDRAPDATKPGQILDGRALLVQVDGDVRLLGKLTKLFLADCPRMLLTIRQAVASRDPQGLQRAAHALKGSIANFAARAPFEAALKLETMGRSGELTGVEEAYLALEKEVTRLERALAALGTGKSRKNPGKGRRRHLANTQRKRANRSKVGGRKKT